MNIPSHPKPRHIKQHLIVTGLFLAGIAALAVLADKLVMPMIIHSSGTVVVPNIIGMSLEESKSLISQRGLQTAGVREVFSDAIERGKIVNQLPYPGAEVKEGRRIYLSVSKGREILKMPPLLGKTLRDARISLMRLGLQLGDITYDFSEYVEKDKIMSQTLPADYSVHFGQAVNIVVSKGSQHQLVMPNVEGLTLDEAKQLLDDAGIRYEVHYVEDETYLANTVISQIPVSGEPLSPETIVILKVANE